ncbi:MAG: hypothetical protein HQL49_12940 [Gammaproteobacteria bacterium]|nr:hypothetical protein [Gammaproteobacteria bacterium]
MSTDQLINDKYLLSENSFAQLIVWALEEPLSGSNHFYKYRFAYVVDGVCTMRFDNEVGKGDHYHVDDREYTYKFISVDQLLTDFWVKVDELEQSK